MPVSSTATTMPRPVAPRAHAAGASTPPTGLYRSPWNSRCTRPSRLIGPAYQGSSTTVRCNSGSRIAYSMSGCAASCAISASASPREPVRGTSPRPALRDRNRARARALRPRRPGTAGCAGNACRCSSQVDAETDARRAFVAAESAAKADRHAIADAARVPDGQGVLAVLPTGAGGQAPAIAAPLRGVDGHAHHRRAHRTRAVDATVLVVEAAVDLHELIGQGLHALVGVGARLGERGGLRGLHLPQVHRIGRGARLADVDHAPFRTHVADGDRARFL